MDKKEQETDGFSCGCSSCSEHSGPLIPPGKDALNKLAGKAGDALVVKKAARGEKPESMLGKSFWVKAARIAASLILILFGSLLFTESRVSAWSGDENVGLWVNFAIFFLAWAIVSYDIVWDSLRSIVKEHNPFDENLLMTIASLGAFCLRFFGPADNEFLEAVLVMMLFQIGESFEDIAASKSRRAIVDAIDLRANKASKLENSRLIVVRPEELAKGDEIIVGVGEIIPVDGTIVKGSGSLDMSSLTGEFAPVYKKEGDEVLSGSLLSGGSLEIRVEKEYRDSTVSKIIALISDSERSKSKADKFINKFARIYTPIVMSLAVLVAVVPPLFLGLGDGSVWARWLYVSLEFLVIGCPCAIVISVPIAYFSGIGLASKNGIVVKGAAYFDQLNSLRWLVSDKTGTLTYGRYAIVKKAPDGIDEGRFMEYLRAAESRSSHPIATAVFAGDPSLKGSMATEQNDYEEFAGFGIRTHYKGHTILAGNLRLLNDNSIAHDASKEPGTVIYLAVDNVYRGFAVLADTLRLESKPMVDELHRDGVKIMLLTGDKQATADKLAGQLGLDEWHAELLPEGKTKFLSEKIAEGRGSVAYVGDGINDAPSIILSDVGIAMGGIGSDASVQNADVVIMNDNPYKVATALKIAQRTKNRAIANIVVSIAVKVAFMICSLTISGFPLWLAAFADSGLTVILVINSFLLIYDRHGLALKQK